MTAPTTAPDDVDDFTALVEEYRFLLSFHMHPRRAAERLGWKYTTLRKRLRAHGINPDHP